MKIFIRASATIFSALLFCSTSLQAKDSLERPSLDVPKSATKLAVAFVNTELWNGKRIDRTMQCKNNGGEKPASPEILVTGFPEQAESLIVFFYNPRAYHNHGTFRVRVGKGDDGWRVPSVADRATTKLPKGVEIFDGGDTWGRAYSAACPTGGSWNYTVTVYALDKDDKVLASGEKLVGWAP